MITVKILRSIGIRKECSDGYAHNLGNHSQGTKWPEMDYLWETWLRPKVGQIMPFDEFQSQYKGLMMASGFPERYAQKMSSLHELRNGAEFAGFIEIVADAQEPETAQETTTIAA